VYLLILEKKQRKNSKILHQKNIYKISFDLIATFSFPIAFGSSSIAFSVHLFSVPFINILLSSSTLYTLNYFGTIIITNSKPNTFEFSSLRFYL
jgi:hypothetical protein